MKTYCDMIDLWGTIRSFSHDTGIQYAAACSMYRRNRVNAKYWPVILKAAHKRAKQEKQFEAVTLDKILKLHEVDGEPRLKRKPKQKKVNPGALGNSAGVVAA